MSVYYLHLPQSLRPTVSHAEYPLLAFGDPPTVQSSRLTVSLYSICDIEEINLQCM